MNTLRCVVAGLTLGCLVGGCQSRQSASSGPAGTGAARTSARLAASDAPPTLEVQRWVYALDNSSPPSGYVWNYHVTDGGPGSGDPVANYTIEFVSDTDQPNHEAVIGTHLQWRLTSGYAIVRGTFPPPPTKENLLLPFWRLFSMNNVNIGIDGCDFLVQFYPPQAPSTEPTFRVYLADASDGHTVKILTGASSNWIPVSNGAVYLASGSAEATDDSNSTPSTVLSEGYQSRIEALAQAASDHGVPESNSTNSGGTQ